MKTSTIFYLVASGLASSGVFTSCTYAEEKKEEAKYGEITGDTLDTGSDPSVPALQNDSFARNEEKAIQAPTDTGSTTAAYAANPSTSHDKAPDADTSKTSSKKAKK